MRRSVVIRIYYFKQTREFFKQNLDELEPK